MFTSHLEHLNSDRTQKISLLHNAKPLLYSEVVHQWQTDRAFRAFFIALLADAPFSAYFWETPPVTTATVDQAFEFVLVDSPPLAKVRPDPSAFERYFQSTDRHEGIVTFSNLGKDAVLVAPSPRAPLSAYPHLAAFVRNAPAPQKHALWRSVGEALERSLNQRPIWVSTSGLGVFWLHVRLDSYPKYYTFRPYKEIMDTPGF